MSTIIRPLAGILSALLVAVGLTVASPVTAPASAAFAAPKFERTISGNGRPGVYPWGLQYNPVSNEVLVGDYLNNQIRRYSPDGKILGSFWRTGATGQPYSLAVDPVNGDVYVPEIADGEPSDKVAVYSKTGTFLRVLRLSTVRYQAWITVDGKGNLFVIDSHYYHTVDNPPRVRVYRTSDGRELSNFSVLPTGTTSTTVPRAYGIDVNPATGDIWLTDTYNNKILQYSSRGKLLKSVSLDGIVTSDARGLELDTAHNRMYISDSGGGNLEVFDATGQYIESLGVPGSLSGRLVSPRQPAVAPDGSVFVAEYGSARVHRFTATGDDAGYFPDPAQPPVAGQLGEPRDVAVDDTTGEVWVADSWNQRFQKFGADGAFLGTWGNRGSSPTYGMNYPRGIAVDAQNDRVWVANQRGHHIKRYTRQGAFVDQLGDAEFDDSGVGHFRWPLDIELDRPRQRVIVTDRTADKVKILDAATGNETGTITVPGNHGAAVDPATGNIYVADSKASKIYQYNAAGTSVIRSFGAPGTADGQFKHIWDMTITGGRLYVTDDTTSRISVFDLNGTYLGRWGGFGSGPYQFKNPSGIDSDAAGRLYVADAANDRVVVYDTTLTKGGGSWPPPTLTVSSPGNNASLSGQPVRLAGSATDESGVAQVEIAVRNTATGEWFDASNSTWKTAQTWSQAPYRGASTKNVQFAWSFIGIEYGATYQAVFRAVDASGNKSTESTRTFTILPKSSTDTVAPTTVVTSPEAGGSLPDSPPATIVGQAGDDVAVASTEVNIRKVGANQWLQPDGSWGAFTWLSATLDDPSSSSSAWRYSWSNPTQGSFVLQARSSDVAGNTEQPVQQEFTVGAAPPPDTTAPTLANVSPLANKAYTADQASIRGTAADDVALAKVEVAIKDKSTGLWRTDSGSWQTAFVWLPVSIPAGASSADWVRSWGATAGSYGYQVRVTDTSGNVLNKAFTSFTVS